MTTKKIATDQEKKIEEAAGVLRAQWIYPGVTVRIGEVGQEDRGHDKDGGGRDEESSRRIGSGG